MNDRMRKKVARAIGDADHGQQGRAALDACHFEELVTALKNLMEDYEDHTVGFVDDDNPNVPPALKAARALLAKVEGSRDE